VTRQMTAASTSVVIIPARIESQRLPRKLLLRQTGKPLIQHTYEAALQAHMPRAVYVATDSEEIASVVRGFGGNVLMTRRDIRSGTDRVAAAVQELSDVEIVVNVQGDEPEISPETIDGLVDLMESDPSLPMSTIAAPISSWEDFESASCVKVVVNRNGDALYFSRSPIPFPRTLDRASTAPRPEMLLHLGVYAYRGAFLAELVNLPSSPYEDLESLEQLRVLEAGYKIKVRVVGAAMPGIDTPEEYATFAERYLTQNAVTAS
jgi:3-deoxy-manno-octulosonate cytidylyltransferase (CMP-KDO synthetase)